MSNSRSLSDTVIGCRLVGQGVKRQVRGSCGGGQGFGGEAEGNLIV
jgi:hypothetical protein